MDNVEDIIRYESECGYIEYKVEEYFKNGFASFLVDVMAMANSSYRGKKYIIIGVSERNGKKKLLGMKKPLEDPSRYDQVLYENVEPEIRLGCKTVEVDEKSYGVFTIDGCDDKPYMMKKDFGDWKKGDCFIRKGTSQHRLMRRDLDAMWEEKQQISRFDGDVKIQVTVEGHSSSVIPIPRFVVLPSEKEEDVLRQALAKVTGKQKSILSTLAPASGQYGYMSAEQLQDQLERVKITFQSEDLYDKFEKHAAKVNLSLLNTGTMYLEDVSVLLTFPALPGLEVAHRIYYEHSALATVALRDVNFINKRQEYATVKKMGETFEIRQPVGQLRHGQAESLFVTAIRVYASNLLTGKRVTVKCFIYAKNLSRPLERETVLQFGE